MQPDRKKKLVNFAENALCVAYIIAAIAFAIFIGYKVGEALN